MSDTPEVLTCGLGVFRRLRRTPPPCLTKLSSGSWQKNSKCQERRLRLLTELAEPLSLLPTNPATSLPGSFSAMSAKKALTNSDVFVLPDFPAADVSKKRALREIVKWAYDAGHHPVFCNGSSLFRGRSTKPPAKCTKPLDIRTQPFLSFHHIFVILFTF